MPQKMVTIVGMVKYQNSGIYFHFYSFDFHNWSVLLTCVITSFYICLRCISVIHCSRSIVVTRCRADTDGMHGIGSVPFWSQNYFGLSVLHALVKAVFIVDMTAL